MVTTCKATVPTINDQASAMQLSQCAKNLASALAELRTASQKLEKCSQDLGTSTKAVTSVPFVLFNIVILFLMLQFPSSGRSFQEIQAKLNEVAAGLNQSANEVVQASRGTTQDLARATSKFGQDFSNFLGAGVDMAGTSKGHAAMEPILTAAQMILESSTGLIQTARSLAVNPKDPPKWSVLAGHSRTVSDSIKKLITNMSASYLPLWLCREKAPGQRECDDAIEVVNGCIREVDQASLAAISQQLAPRDDISMETLHEQMAASVHEISNLIDPVAVAARSEASHLGHKAAYMQNALEDSVQMMKEAVDDLGATLGEAASAAGAVGGMVDSINHAINKMEDGPADEPDGTFVDYQTTMVKTAKAIAVTVQEMCSPNDSFTKKELIESARKVSEKVRQEYILKTAKALVEDTKLLVSGAGASQERLAQAAQSSVSTITKLADVVKLGAASLGSEDPETQVVLINAVKDVAKALGNLISATKAAAGKPHDDPSMLQLKSSAKVFCSSDPPPKTTTPEEFIRMTKGITVATAKAVAAGNSCRQEDIIATANLSRRAIADMLHSCK
ncbi:hypothetical protein XENOCAPTIV_004901, partial [Xenoophorus captivus]